MIIDDYDVTFKGRLKTNNCTISGNFTLSGQLENSFNANGKYIYNNPMA